MRIDGFELAAINGNDCLTKQIQSPKQNNELAADITNAMSIVTPEICNDFEVRA